MPNFHTHWLVALSALDGLAQEYDYLRTGRDSYVDRATTLRGDVRALVRGILDRADLDAAAALQKTIGTKVEEWEKRLRDDEDAICFSAYCLGACGPDFWMLPCDTTSGYPDMAPHHFDLGHYNRTHRQFEVSLNELKGKPDGLQARVEKAYFLGMSTHIGADLVLHELVNVSAGAYNLLKMDMVPPGGTWSNEQGIEYLSPGTPAPPQPAPEGNFAQRAWGNVANTGKAALHHVGDGGGKAAADAVPIWTTHNKVEHYWDTWVRYRWLGDFGKVWEDDVEASSFPVLGLPLCDTLRRDLLGRTDTVAGMGNSISHYVGDGWRALGRALPGDDTANRRKTVLERLDYALGSVETRWLLEKPLAFPWLFADAVLGGQCGAFVYDRVVDKKTGAYPEALVYKGAKTEAESPQMNEPPGGADPGVPGAGLAPSPGGGRSEKRKLQFFSTERNRAIPSTSWNYLNYVSCPNHERLVKYGADKFYDRKAFPPFTAVAVAAAKAFASGLGTAYTSRAGLAGKVGQFWNLDTGLGLQVRTLRSPERHHVVTCLDWIHVLGPPAANQKIAYARPLPPPYTAAMKAADEPYPLAAWKDGSRAFTVYPSPQFESLKTIVEDESVKDARKYLDRIGPKAGLAAKPSAPIFDRLRDAKVRDSDDELDKALFVKDGPAPPAPSHPLPTGKSLKAELLRIEHRLDLVVRASIARIGARPGDVAMYLLSDKADDVQKAESDDAQDESATHWLRERSKILDRVIEPTPDPDLDKVGLATFSARIIVNLSKDKKDASARVVQPAGAWNNVVPWEVHKGHYGRNFAVATARTHTLRGKNRKPPYNFDPTADYLDLQGLGLTEHCFFTLYPLVRIGDEWIDAFSKQPVTDEGFKRMKKVEATNFVKIVLMYVLDGDQALNLGWCYLDGMRHEVKEVDG